MKSKENQTIMRHLIICVLISFVISESQCQTKGAINSENQNSHFFITHCKDKMTDAEYYGASKPLICSDGEKGFSIRPSFKMYMGNLVYEGLDVLSNNIGTNCVEKSNLIFLFNDDTKTYVNSWNDYNCKGISFMDKTKLLDEADMLKKVVAIRFTNGNSGDSFTFKVPIEYQTYFNEVISALNKKDIREINCSGI
jgi:hypothetical protein